jgi:hypothetical protein
MSGSGRVRWEANGCLLRYGCEIVNIGCQLERCLDVLTGSPPFMLTITTLILFETGLPHTQVI